MLRAGHVGGGNVGRGQVAIARHRRVRGQRRAADGAQIDRQLEMPLDAERRGDGARRLDLARVALAVVDRQRVQREAARAFAIAAAV